jgi:hypothetical protein
VLEYHSDPVPDACDVCKYAVEHELDCGYEHARTNLARAWLVEDLAEAGESVRLSSVAVSAAGVEPGPVHQLEPRHWFWAMFFEPEIRISLRRRPGE